MGNESLTIDGSAVVSLDAACAAREDSPGPAMSETPETPLPKPPRRRLRTWFGLVLLLGAVATGVWLWAPWRTPGQPAGSTVSVPAAGPAVEPAATPAPVVSEADVLRNRLDDLASVNRTLRAQVLSLTQRLGLVEDGIDNVRRGDAPGIDGMRIEEAHLLLGLAEQRLLLLGDRTGALAALDVADAQLREVAQLEVARVRQTLALEREALRAAGGGIDVPVVLGRLDQLASAVQEWPGSRSEAVAAPADAGWTARIGAALDRYFRVRRVGGESDSLAGPLARERLLLDLSRTRWLLLRGDFPAAAGALASARAVVAAAFPAEDAAVAAGLATLDELTALPWTAEAPGLGEARRELARLRGAGSSDRAAPLAIPEPGPEAIDEMAAKPHGDGDPPAGPEAAAPELPEVEASESEAPVPEDDDALDP
jgi:uroporphyrin-III C-methyltransferase